MFPKLTYALLDALDVGFRIFLLDGDDGTLFGRFREQDQVSATARYGF